jgi:hypothetical protein
MKHFVEGEERSQSTLFPERLDDYFGEDNRTEYRRRWWSAFALTAIGRKNWMFVGSEHGGKTMAIAFT